MRDVKKRKTFFNYNELALISAPIETQEELSFEWTEYYTENISIFIADEKSSDDYLPSYDEINNEFEVQYKFLDNMRLAYKLFNDNRLNIFIFPKHISEVMIGTSGGGFYNGEKNSILFCSSGTIKLPRNNEISLIGYHETVHFLQFENLGISYSRLLVEGLANYFDGAYGIEYVEEKINKKQHYKWIEEQKKSNNILCINDLVQDSLLSYKIDESIFYPQSAAFISWLLAKYGFDKYKELYRLEYELISGKIYDVIGDRKETIENDYKDYILNIYQ